MKALPAPLLVITDRHQARHPIETIAEAIGTAGGRWLLLRDKDLEPAPRRSLAARLAEVSRRCGIHLSVSRDVDLAAEFGASVHLQSAAAVGGARRRLGHSAMIGVSAHGQGDVAAAAAAGADYVTLSPIFLTASKPGYGPALGLAGIGADHDQDCRRAPHGLPDDSQYAGQDVCLGLVVAALRFDDDDQRGGFGGPVGE